MGIYTRTGDAGMTRRIDGELIAKDSDRIRAVGGIDELNSAIGLCLCLARRSSHNELVAHLEPIQSELFAIGAAVAAADTARPATLNLGPQMVDRMEKLIDDAFNRAGPLQHFILPGGCEVACALHLARTGCRRAERDLVTFQREEAPSLPPILGQYLNRLSDLLFALARAANHDAGVPETQWSRDNAAETPPHG